MKTKALPARVGKLRVRFGIRIHDIDHTGMFEDTIASPAFEFTDNAELHPGRRNQHGAPVVFTSGSFSLAALEMLVNLHR